MENKWEKVNEELGRMKVDGGYLYAATASQGIAMCLVPDVDLTRYQSHLRDAYTQGYKDGVEDGKSGLNDEDGA